VNRTITRRVHRAPPKPITCTSAPALQTRASHTRTPLVSSLRRLEHLWADQYTSPFSVLPRASGSMPASHPFHAGRHSQPAHPYPTEDRRGCPSIERKNGSARVHGAARPRRLVPPTSVRDSSAFRPDHVSAACRTRSSSSGHTHRYRPHRESAGAALILASSWGGLRPRRCVFRFSAPRGPDRPRP